MHELVAVVARAQHEHGRAVGDELEQDGHDAEPAVPEDRARPDDRDVDARSRRRRGTAARPAASPGRTPRAGGGGVSSVTGLCSGIPKIALDDVCTTLPTPASRAATSKLAVPVTFTESKRSGSLASGTWATLCSTTSTSVHASRTTARSRMSPATYSTSQLGLGRVEVEHAHRVAGSQRLASEHRSEVAAPARDQDRGDPSECDTSLEAPPDRLARMPSNKPTSGS